ncbi:hypothetical protein [Falsiroseomonas sp.]|jgi:hypothetical protein
MPNASSLPFRALSFRARTPVRDFLRNLKRWLTYKPHRAYMRGR